MPGALARELRRLGIDVETTPEAGLLGASDEAHLAHARRHGRVVVTDDADFAGLHYRHLTSGHSGIVFFPGGRRPIGQMVELLRLVYETYTAEEMVGRLEYR